MDATGENILGVGLHEGVKPLFKALCYSASCIPINHFNDWSLPNSVTTCSIDSPAFLARVAFLVSFIETISHVCTYVVKEIAIMIFKIMARLVAGGCIEGRHIVNLAMNLIGVFFGGIIAICFSGLGVCFPYIVHRYAMTCILFLVGALQQRGYKGFRPVEYMHNYNLYPSYLDSYDQPQRKEQLPVFNVSKGVNSIKAVFYDFNLDIED